MFFNHYNLEENNAGENTVIGLYFAITTLSTVGFGDYTPRSDFERGLGTFILISGVMMFSYLMGQFIDILSSYQDLSASFDDGDNLTRFFGMLRHFNNEEDIDTDLKKKIEVHFDYRWDNDLNQAFLKDDFMPILPHLVQDKVYKDFLFTDFFFYFERKYFLIPKPMNTKSLFTWEDQNYRDFMVGLLRSLEPRFEPAGTQIFQTLTEVRSIYFIMQGSVDVGFEINRLPKYVVRLGKGSTFGMYNVTFEKKTMFCYKIKHDFHGFTIRKMNWKILMWNPDFEDITKYVKKQVLFNFELEIKFKVIAIYQKYIRKIRERNSQSEILTVLNVNDDGHVLMRVEAENSTSKPKQATDSYKSDALEKYT